jgi:fibronectin type 3 domain-containing protein
MLWLDVVHPNPPFQLTAKSISRGVELSWKEGIPSEDGEKAYGYVIYRFPKGSTINIGNPANIVNISFNAQLTSFTDKGVSANNTYVYVVTAIDRLKNESAVSNVAEARVLQ